jgi:MraZ protein
MFLGQYQHTIDEKGRLTIPARYRDLLAADGAFVTQGFDRNILVLTTSSFEAVYKRINQMNMTDPAARLLKRLIFASATKVELDKAGRILIPQFLRDAGSLDGEATVVGMGHYFEVWSSALWADQAAQLQDADANAQRFIAFDLSPEM